jgi:uncharacterized protein YgiM (DUF1202 family)
MRLLVAALGFAMVALGCSASDPTWSGTGSGSNVGDTGDTGDAPLAPADDSIVATNAQALSLSQTIVTTANLNLRKGPGTSYSVIVVIPSGSTVKLLDATAQNGFYNISWNGNAGWSSGAYLKATSSGSSNPPPSAGDPNGPPSPANAIARAQASVGFSYYWGGGAWLASGPTSSSAGSCSGSCPSCTHSGKYGADCSGMVGKAWEFGTVALDVNSHPYSTSSFVNDVSGKWSTVSRGSLKAGDAMVYNSNGSGHIVLWEKGDGWGSSTVYECRGCSYGCVHDTRTFSSSYHGIRRAGF